MPDYLLLIALGPVQDFIATARKTRDLWFGSYLLSECSKAVAKYLQNQELIFPNPQEKDLEPKQPRGLNVANIILCKILATDETEAKAIAEAAIQAGKSRLNEIRDDALTKNKNKAVLSPYQLKIVEKQIDDLLESYWAITQWQEKESYTEVRRRVSHTLDARKATRTFQAPTWAMDSIPKSSLDGAREIVTPDDDKDHNLRRLGLKKGERLCGVGLVKRLGMRGIDPTSHEKFASTSSVAASTIVTQENMAQITEYFEAVNKIAGGNDDSLFDLTGAALFQSRLQEFLDYDEPEKKTLNERIKIAQEKLKSLFKDISKGKEPLPYYALFLGDGDNMGKTIDLLTTQGIKKHQDFSSDLAGFATKAREIVEDAQGCLIYAGGDDVLALLPLHTALECSWGLNQAFDQAVGQYEQTYKDTKGKNQTVKPSFSAGMVVWHHLEPLQEALEAARAAEKKAKEIEGKNALCITVAKRSGADIGVKGKYQELTTSLQEVRATWVADALPDGVAFELRDMIRELEGIPEAQIVEAERILNRKNAQKFAIDIFIKKLQVRVGKKPQDKKHAEWLEIVNELLVARLFADAAKLRNIVAKDEKRNEYGKIIKEPV